MVGERVSVPFSVVRCVMMQCYTHTHTHNCRTIILRADETVELFISIASSFWVHSWCWYSWDTDFCCTNNARKKYYELNLEHRWILIKLIFKLCGVVNAKHVSHALSVAPQRVQLKQAIPINVWLCAVCWVCLFFVCLPGGRTQSAHSFGAFEHCSWLFSWTFTCTTTIWEGLRTMKPHFHGHIITIRLLFGDCIRNRNVRFSVCDACEQRQQQHQNAYSR